MIGIRTASLALAIAASALTSPVLSADKVPVVATFSILGDIVREVGGERVELKTIVGPGGDAHVYQPTPTDAAAVTKASVVFVNGLAFEGWIDRLIKSSGYKGPIVTATKGIKAVKAEEEHDEEGHKDEHGHNEHGHEKHAHDKHGHDNHGHEKQASKKKKHSGHDHGEFDPHAWQSVSNVVTYVANVKDGLCKVDKASCNVFTKNATDYTAKLKALDKEIKGKFASIAADKRKVITSHDAFGYFANAYGVSFMAPTGISTESEASAKDVAKLIDQIRDEGVSAVFVENISDKRLIEQIVRETGAQIGGTLYSDALSDASGPAGTYIDMMRYNSGLI